MRIPSLSNIALHLLYTLDAALASSNVMNNKHATETIVAALNKYGRAKPKEEKKKVQKVIRGSIPPQQKEKNQLKLPPLMIKSLTKVTMKILL